MSNSCYGTLLMNFSMGVDGRLPCLQLLLPQLGQLILSLRRQPKQNMIVLMFVSDNNFCLLQSSLLQHTNRALYQASICTALLEAAKCSNPRTLWLDKT